MEESSSRYDRLTGVLTGVLLYSPITALRMGLHSLLAADPGFRIIGEASSLADLQTFVGRADVIMAGGIRPGDLSRLVDFGKPVVLATNETGDIQELAGSRLPGWGLVPEEFGEEEILNALRAAASGLLVGSPGLMEELLVSRQTASLDLAEMVEPLTAREMEVLQLIAQGMANKQIALYLGISEHTVKFHLSSIYTKLSVSSRTEAVNAGLRRGMIVV